MIDLDLMKCFFDDIVVFEVDYWETRRKFCNLIFFGAGNGSGSIVFGSGALGFSLLESGFDSLSSK